MQITFNLQERSKNVSRISFNDRALSLTYMGGLKKHLIVRAIQIIKQEIAYLKIIMEPEHIAEMVMAWEHGYSVRWNPKYYVRPFIQESYDHIIIICRGNPSPIPGPFRILSNDVELIHSRLTVAVNEKIKKLIGEARKEGF